MSRGSKPGKRLHYPFHKFGQGSGDGTDYSSEFEADDSAEYTITRRQIKDNLELELREIDTIPARTVGNAEVLDKFVKFMERRKSSPKTIGVYKRLIEVDLFRCFQDSYRPCDMGWILDPITEKEFLFDGEESRKDKKEPLYLTRTIIDRAMKRFDVSGGMIGDQRSQFLSAVKAFMLFIEDYYSSKMEVFGYQPFEDVTKMHRVTNVFIDSHALWRAGNVERNEARAKSKALKDLKCPNEEHQILLKYREYLNGSELRDGLEALEAYARPDSPPISDKEFVELGECSKNCYLNQDFYM